MSESITCPNCKSVFPPDEIDGKVQCPNCSTYITVEAVSAGAEERMAPPAGGWPEDRVTTRKIAFANHKCDVGKTASVIHVGAGLAALGKRVLLVDLDPQATLTHRLGLDTHALKRSIYEVLCAGAPIRGTVLARRPFDVVPSSLDLSGAELELSGTVGRELLLSKSLSELGGYDYVLMDCPSSLGLLTLNAMAAADELYVPIHTELVALQSMAKLAEILEIVKHILNPSLEITGVIATRYDAADPEDAKVLKIVRSYFGDVLFGAPVRADPRVAEAEKRRRTLYELDAQGPAAQDYAALTREVIDRRVVPALGGKWSFELESPRK